MKKSTCRLFYIIFVSFMQVLIGFCFLSAKENNFKVPRKPYNVILISIDTLRADHLGCYGYYRDTSPNIDKLAKGGILFEQAIAQANWTLPSHSALFTSQYLPLYGAQNFGKLSDSDVTLAEVLKAKGYKTAAFTGRGDVRSTYGFNQGFDVFDEGTPDIGWSRTFKDTVPLALAWIKRNKNNRFFVFLHGYDPHEPYNNPNENMFDPDYKGIVDNMPLTALGRRLINFYYLNEVDEVVKISQRDVDHIIAHYDSCIRHADNYIGKFIQEIKKMGIWDDAIVILLSDHGEELGDHGIISRHQGSSYEEVIHVPLIIKYPRNKPKRIRTQAQLIDIMPTVLDFLDVPKNKESQGNSLLPLIEGTAPHDFNEFVYSSRNVIRSLKWKAIFISTHELYDLDNDSKEQNNVINEHSGIFLRLYKKLRHWRDLCFLKSREKLSAKNEEEFKNNGYW